MMFKGTRKTGPEEYSRIIRRNGGNENAFTSADQTVYFATLASDRIDLAVDLEADRMVNLVFREDLFGPERDVVAEERRLRTEDNPVGELFEQISATAYSAHPYQWPVIGWMNDIQKATLADLERYYRTYYRPNNAFAVIVGNVDAAKITKKLRKRFGSHADKAAPPHVRAAEPPQQGERRVELRRQAELPFVGVSYHVPNLRHADSAALEVLAAVLSGGKSSRLYDDLVYGKRKALSVGAAYDRTSHDPGLFTVYGRPLPGVEAEALLTELLEHLERLKAAAPGDREITTARNGLEAEFILAQDSLFYQGMLLGQHEIAGDWRWIDEFLPAVDKVTPADLQRVAQTYFSVENRTVGILVPEAVVGADRGGSPGHGSSSAGSIR
jgi:zinc protease